MLWLELRGLTLVLWRRSRLLFWIFWCCCRFGGWCSMWLASCLMFWGRRLIIRIHRGLRGRFKLRLWVDQMRLCRHRYRFFGFLRECLMHFLLCFKWLSFQQTLKFQGGLFIHSKRLRLLLAYHHDQDHNLARHFLVMTWQL
jgi:hypothetical protein